MAVMGGLLMIKDQETQRESVAMIWQVTFLPSSIHNAERYGIAYFLRF